MKGVVDYLKTNGEYTHNIIGRNFTLELKGKIVTLKALCYEWQITANPIECVEDRIQSILEENFGIEIRFCRTCGKPIDAGMTNDFGDFYSCESCFEIAMNEEYGKERWRTVEEAGEHGGYYEHLKNDGTWEDTGIYYTEWY